MSIRSGSGDERSPRRWEALRCKDWADGQSDDLIVENALAYFPANGCRVEQFRTMMSISIYLALAFWEAEN